MAVQAISMMIAKRLVSTGLAITAARQAPDYNISNTVGTDGAQKVFRAMSPASHPASGDRGKYGALHLSAQVLQDSRHGPNAEREQFRHRKKLFP